MGYECYGMQSDLEYFEERMKHEGYRFEIDEAAWPNTGGQLETGQGRASGP